MEKLPHAMSAQIEKVTDSQIVIKLQDNQSINWPKKLISQDIKRGDKVEIIILTEKEINKEKRSLAKSVLKEMLNGE